MRILIVSKINQAADETLMEVQRVTRLCLALRRGGMEVEHSWVETIEGLQGLLLLYRPDLVFSTAFAVSDEQGNSRIINGLLEQEHIAYIGSDEASLELALSKATLKDRWRAAGILTPEDFVVQRMPNGKIHGMDMAIEGNKFPYILKPSEEGNSRGISQKSIVGDVQTLREGLLELLDTYDEILVEKYLGECEPLREFTVAMIGNHHQKLLLPSEIVLKKKGGYRIITTEDKDEHNTRAFAVDDQVLHRELILLAERAFTVAGVRDYARFDVLYSGGQLYAIEVNGQPMVPDRWFEACARGAGLDTDQYLNAIFLAGIVRNTYNGHPGMQIPGGLSEILPGDIYRQLNLVEKEFANGRPT
jgi:D-alanine-D-alanine ligase